MLRHTRMFKMYYMIAATCAAMLLIVVPMGANAQEDVQQQAQPQEITQPEPAIVDAAPQTPQDVISDTQVTNEDLHVEDVGVLPDSPLYGLKNFGRAFQEVFTFDPVKKAELRLEHANEQFAEAQQLLAEKPNDEKALEKAAEVAEKAVHRLEKIGDVADRVKERRDEGDERAQELLENVLDKQIKHQKVIEQIEQRVFDSASHGTKARTQEKLAQAKEDGAKSVGTFVSGVEENPEALAQTIDRVLENQRGSEFKDLKNLEVLKRVETFVPDQARDAIRKAQDNAFKRFNNRMEQVSPDQRGERFEQYAEHIPGDSTVFFEQFDQLKASGALNDDLAKKLEKVKDISARRFKQDVERIEGDFTDEAIRGRMRERMLSRFKQEQPNVEQLRTIKEMRERVQFDDKKIEQEMRVAEEESVRKFTQTFTDDTSQTQAKRFKELSEKMASNPDPVTFRLLEALEKEVMSDPKKKAFIESMEAQTRAQFAQRAHDEGDEFLSRIATANPEDIAVFERLREDFEAQPDAFFGGPEGFGSEGFEFGPPSFGGDFEGGSRQFMPPPNIAELFEKAQKKQAERITQHVKDVKDPALFAEMQKRFNAVDPRVLEQIKQQQSQFENIFSQQRQFIQDQELKQREEGLRQELESQRQSFEQEFNSRMNTASDQERDSLIKERAEKERSLRNREWEERQKMFDSRLQFDPFCDEQCQREERGRFEQMRNKERERFDEEDEFQNIERELRDYLDQNMREDRGQQFDGQNRFEDERSHNEFQPSSEQRFEQRFNDPNAQDQQGRPPEQGFRPQMPQQDMRSPQNDGRARFEGESRDRQSPDQNSQRQNMGRPDKFPQLPEQSGGQEQFENRQQFDRPPEGFDPRQRGNQIPQPSDRGRGEPQQFDNRMEQRFDDGQARDMRFENRNIQPPQEFRFQGESRPDEQAFKTPPRPEEVFERLQERRGEEMRERMFTESRPPESEQRNQMQPIEREAPPFIEPQPSPMPIPEMPVQIIPAPAEMEIRDMPPQSAVQRYLSRLFGSLVIKAAMAGW